VLLAPEGVVGPSEPDELGAVLAGALELVPETLELLRSRQLSRSAPVRPAHRLAAESELAGLAPPLAAEESVAPELLEPSVCDVLGAGDADVLDEPLLLIWAHAAPLSAIATAAAIALSVMRCLLEG
jgi:hypothetical protein